MPVRILYIDDDPVLARLAEKILGRHDFDVVHAPSIAEGLELFATGSFDAIVLDHHFQDRTGLHFLEAIEDRVNLIPILYVTGSSDAQVAIKALKSGAADYVMKSATDDFFPLLVTALHQALENTKLRHAKAESDRLLVSAKERAEMLVAEMNHRIANSLALVSAMIRMQIQAVGSEETRFALSETQSRISAIAGVHRSLYTSDTIGEVDLQIYLGSLIRELEGSTGGSAKQLHIVADLAPTSLSADKAVALGVIVTELITNAVKYAYPQGAGDIRITLRPADGSISLCVEDDGIGYNPSDGPKGTGLGTRLLHAMASNLGATITTGPSDPIASSGFRVVLQWSVGAPAA